MNQLNDKFYMNFYGDTAAVEAAFSEWKYAGEPERSGRGLRYVIDTSSFTDQVCDEEDAPMDPLEIFYYVLYPGQMPDESYEELPRWNRDGFYWDGGDDTWQYCMIGASRQEADELFLKYLPENESMFEAACVIRFTDESSFIEYLKCEALGYRGNHTQDLYASENMALHHMPDVPLSYRVVPLSEIPALPPNENLGLYAFCRSGEEARSLLQAAGSLYFGARVVSEDVPESFGGVLVPVYDDDVQIERTLCHIQNNYASEGGLFREKYRAGIHIIRTSEGSGLFDAAGGRWIYPHLCESLYDLGGEDDGYVVTVQDGKKGLLRIMGDSRLHRIVAALLLECEYDEIELRGGEIICVEDGTEYAYDKTRDRIERKSFSN